MKKQLLAGVLGLALFGLTACGAADTPAQTPTAQGEDATKVTIGLTFIPNVQFSPFYIAQEQSKSGDKTVTPIELRHHGQDEGLFTALEQGEEQLVVAGGDEAVVAAANGLDLVVVGSYYQHYPAVLIVPADSDIKSPKDLKGRKVGIPGHYGENWYATLVMLKESGLTEQDVQVQDIGYTAQAALSNNSVDAVVGFSNNDLVQFGFSQTKVRSIDISASQVPLVSASLITTKKFAEQHPEALKSVLKNCLIGMQTVSEDSEAALDATAKQVPNLKTGEDREKANATLQATVKIMQEGSRGFGQLDEAQWDKMEDFLVEQGIIELPLKGSWRATNEFLPAEFIN